MILAIYCAGGLGREVLEMVRRESRWAEILFVDDVTDAKECRGARVLRFPDVAALAGDVEFLIASGEPAVRKVLYEKIKSAGYPMATFISPYASIAEGVEIGEGCFLSDCILSVDVVIKENTILNGRAVVGHDVVVGPHSVLSQNCIIGGETTFGECVYMAPGSLAKDRIRIADYAIIGMGAVLLRNVRQEAIMLGNPARNIGENTKHKVF